MTQPMVCLCCQVRRIGAVDFVGAMRDVVIVDPGDCAETQICFQANNPGVWPLHCHMTYHLAAGMLTTVEYAATASETAEQP